MRLFVSTCVCFGRNSCGLFVLVKGIVCHALDLSALTLFLARIILRSAMVFVVNSCEMHMLCAS